MQTPICMFSVIAVVTLHFCMQQRNSQDTLLRQLSVTAWALHSFSVSTSNAHRLPDEKQHPVTWSDLQRRSAPCGLQVDVWLCKVAITFIRPMSAALPVEF